MDYPTAEEEYEMMYADELQAMEELEAENEMCYNDIDQPAAVAPSQQQQQPPQPTSTHAKSTPTTLFKSLQSQTSIKNQSTSLFSNSIVESPQLSQIPLDPVLVQINRKLFGTPQHHTKQTRPSSTPNRDLPGILSASQSALAELLPNSQPVPDAITIPNATINTRKRRLEDLFGDIQDIEREEQDFNYLDVDGVDDDNDHDDNGNHYFNERGVKKMKTQEEIDQDMIKKIIIARKRYRMEQKHPVFNNRSQYLNHLDAQSKFKRQNLALTVPNFPFITIRRNYDNLRIYVRMHSEEYEDNEIMNIKCDKNITQLFRNNLNDADVDDDDGDAIQHQMWLDANKIIEDKLIADSKKANKNGNQDEIQEIFTNDELSQSSLWVEKYRPKRYIDLLSDETTNRSLLLWLKMWDKIVFNREFKTNSQNSQSGINQSQQQQQQWTKSNEQRNTFNKRTGKFEQNGGWRKKSERTALKLDIDEYGRPIQKIALLCGPPGLGKTTLAHTIARHAGYAVRELNASDDRNLDAFKQTLENCTQMNSILTKEKRPNCIILDEIDGAPQTSIDYLIRFVNDTATGQNAKSKSKVKGKSGNNHHILKRPIICICNDMYTPALRQLRQMALVVNFPPMESERLADRLEYISRNERIITDMTSLLTLSEKTGNDVRSCLAMLQFYNALRKPLTIVDVLNSNVGQKDRHKNLFNVWTSIFQIHRPYKSINEQKNDINTDTISMTDSSLTSRMNNVLDAVHMGGDFERILNGVFENYLTQKMPDPNMHGVAEATEWFCFTDKLLHKINKDQNYDIYPYLPYGFVAWHYLFASLAWPKITFPTKGYEFSQKSTLHKMTYNSLRKGFSINCCSIGDGSAIILDSIPNLKKILNPSLRSVSLQLLTPKEQHDLRHTVNIMVDLGLAYTQIKSIDGKFIYQMEPDIENLCKFDIQQIPTTTTTTTEQKLSYWGRQLIAREVELEKIKRALPKINKKQQQQNQQNSGTSKSNSNNTKQKSTQLTIDKQIDSKKSTTSTTNEQNTSPELPNFKKQLKPKKIIGTSAVKETITKDFFGRITTKEKIVTVKEGGTDEIIKSPIWYRYKEGFNNAVRKDVTISSLL